MILSKKRNYPKIGMILAAGFGTRMGEYTKNVPKPLLEINSHPLITYSLFLLYLWKIDYVVINLHYKKEKIKEALKNFPYFPIFYSEEETILGTAGGIAYAIYQNLLKDYFLVINPDTIFFPKINPFNIIPTLKNLKINHFLFMKSKNKKNAKETSFVIEKEIKKNIYKFNLSKTDFSKSFFYSGLSIFHVDFFSYYKQNTERQPKNNLTDIFKKELIEILNPSEIYGRIYTGIRIDCGTKEDYERIKQKDLIRDIYKKRWATFLKGWFG
ncbi:MAG: NDP-sugar synthase [Leptonema sp. (in: bacteria)]